MKYTIFDNNNDKYIILYHGWGGTINNNQQLINKLYQQGYTVIVPELIYHDTRQTLNNHFTLENMYKYFWNCIFQSIDEFTDLIKHIKIPVNKTVICGISMGGFIASGILKQNKELKGLICINGSPSFLQSEEIFRNVNHREEMTNEDRSKLQYYDPIQYIPYESKILLLHGEKDTVVSIKGSRSFYNHQMTDQLSQTTLKTYQNVNHAVTDAMIEDIIEWLKSDD